MLQGRNKDVVTYFEKHWKDGTITLHEHKVLIDDSLIAQVTGLSADGMIWKKTIQR